MANVLPNIVPLKTSILLAPREGTGNSGKTMECHGTIDMSGRVKILFNHAMHAGNIRRGIDCDAMADLTNPAGSKILIHRPWQIYCILLYR